MEECDVVISDSLLSLACNNLGPKDKREGVFKSYLIDTMASDSPNVIEKKSASSRAYT
jgi:hypothetical protein